MRTCAACLLLSPQPKACLATEHRWLVMSQGMARNPLPCCAVPCLQCLLLVSPGGCSPACCCMEASPIWRWTLFSWASWGQVSRAVATTNCQCRMKRRTLMSTVLSCGSCSDVHQGPSCPPSRSLHDILLAAAKNKGSVGHAGIFPHAKCLGSHTVQPPPLQSCVESPALLAPFTTSCNMYHLSLGKHACSTASISQVAATGS